MNRIYRSWLLKVFLLGAFILGQHASINFVAKAEVKPSLVILPFFVERPKDLSRGVVLCPLCKGLFHTGEIVPGSQNLLTRLLYEKIKGIERFEVISLEKAEKVLSPSIKRQIEEKPISSFIQIGKELRADFILVGYLFRFEERIGSALGVERPASVGLDVHLFRLRDGIEVWNRKFNETQRPLSENLFKIGSFIRRKASWLTAEELASVGMDEMLKALPTVQELEEKRP